MKPEGRQLELERDPAPDETGSRLELGQVWEARSSVGSKRRLMLVVGPPFDYVKGDGRVFRQVPLLDLETGKTTASLERRSRELWRLVEPARSRKGFCSSSNELLLPPGSPPPSEA